MGRCCKLVIGLDERIGVVDPNIFGHFIEHLGRCIYPGIWVGRSTDIPNEDGLRMDVIQAFRLIDAPIIRWPGGCFADTYHWIDGIGPVERRPRRINIWWGGEETNEFGTDEFVKLCRLVGAEPYICVNVGSGSPEEALAWLEYCNRTGDSSYAKLRVENGHSEPYNVKYWGIGNESWGCGGSFDPVYYAWEYRRFATFLKQADPTIKLIACGHTSTDWNLRFMESLRNFIHLIDYLSIHYYFFRNLQRYGGDIDFTDEQYLNLLFDIQHLEYEIKQAISIVDFFSEGRKDIGIAVDEWGVWHPQATVENGLYQQNTLRDAILAASVLNLFIKYSRKVRMANIAQAVNVLQSICLTRDRETILTPTYYVFQLYRPHMGSIALRAEVESPVVREPTREDLISLQRVRRKLEPLKAIDASASIDPDGANLVITLVNRSLDEDFDIDITLVRGYDVREGEFASITSKNVRSYNDFDMPNNVRIVEEPVDIKGNRFSLNIQKHSINRLILKLSS
ncbi:MAG: alpha-L-arabinofuranosidase C-terminal domain-containing protein [Nitrososphaerota archaeon]|nr:alpha-N-arabinofuranosidase [Candidatus Bathyarchaeota archaeon]MDW8061606.1 alpha-L-arabinofuranosidase C-terminal domain-containing protein [Nitrososphaerota archaeon]